MSWAQFWAEASIDTALWQGASASYVAQVLARVPLSPEARVLDYGCGPGETGPLLAHRVREVWLVDASPGMIARARAINQGLANVHCLHLPDGDPTALPPQRFDLILCNSVVQYVALPQLVTLLWELARRLAPGGCLMLSDLLPPGRSLLSDLPDVLRWAWRWGGVWGVVRTLAGEAARWPQRAGLPLTRLTHAEMEALVPRTLRIEWTDSLTICSQRVAVLLHQAPTPEAVALRTGPYPQERNMLWPSLNTRIRHRP